MASLEGSSVSGNSIPLEKVALLADIPERNLWRGQVGQVVQALDEELVLVEFTYRDGASYSLTPISSSKLLPLLFEPPPPDPENLPIGGGY